MYHPLVAHISQHALLRGVYLVPGGVHGQGVYLVGGVYLVLGGVPGQGGCTWSRGVPGPGDGVPGLGGVSGPGGCTWSGGVPAQVLPIL